MKKLSLSELYRADFDCTVLNSLIQRWEDVKFFDCRNDHKREDIMLFLSGYDATYTLDDGRKIEAKSGEVTYTATGSRYRVDFRRAKGAETAHDDSIRFRLSLHGEPIRLDADVAVFRPSSAMIAAFRRVHSLSRLVDPPQAEYKAVLYSILTEACVLDRDNDQTDDFALVRPAYDYINLHYDEDFSIKTLADLCYVSEVWFRKAFRAATGLSPVAYKTELRLGQAAKLLACGNMSVQEIATAVGYDDVSLFIRRFREKYSLTPLGYRRFSRERNQ